MKAKRSELLALGHNMIGRLQFSWGIDESAAATCPDCELVSYDAASKRDVNLLGISRWHNLASYAGLLRTCDKHREQKSRFPWADRLDPYAVGKFVKEQTSAFVIDRLRQFLPEGDPDRE